MDAELIEISEFLATQVPYDTLEPRRLAELPGRLAVRYYRRGTRIFALGDRCEEVYVLRSGAVDIHDENGTLRDRRAPGATFGARGVLEGGHRRYTATAREDSLLLVMPGEVMRDLTAADGRFAAYFTSSQNERLHNAVERVRAGDLDEPILRTRIRDLVQRGPLFVEPGCSIRDAAVAMSAQGLSSLLVMTGGRPVGIVTDRDLRTRVLAADLDPGEPISAIMTPDPVTVDADGMAFEVLLGMVAENIHHAPVVAADEVLGVVTSTDLLRLENSNPVYLVGGIAKQSTVAGLSRASRRLPGLVAQLMRQDSAADDVGRIVTAVGDAIERRLLQLAEAELGPPPVPYCWVVLGSQARLEQGLSSDQDNALVIGDDVTEADLEYFAELARRVSDGLADCGYSYCTGDIMATNPRWRLTASQWRSTFRGWTERPDPEALLRSTIFFDMRAVHGQLSLVEELRRELLASTPAAKVFLAHLAKQAVARTPPIGFFREFVLEPEGDHTDTLDLKRGGVGAVVELARVYALSLGQPAVNTQARLAAAAAGGLLSRATADDLSDALEFISVVRLQHQGRQVRAGQSPDNFVAPSELSGVERRHLRDVFQVVRKAQSALAAQYPLSYIS